MNTKIKSSIVSLITFAPILSLAANSKDVSDVLDNGRGVVVGAIQFIISLCILLFFYGLYLLFFQKTETDTKKGIKFIIGAIIALAVMLSIWGLVAILNNTLGLDTSGAPSGLNSIFPDSGGGGGSNSRLCGNGAIDSREECDGSNFGGKSCQSLGFRSGTLSCSSSCRINTSSCSDDSGSGGSGGGGGGGHVR